MAEEQHGNNPMSDLWFIVLLIVGLVILWYANGGPQHSDLRGIFLSPPPPLGTGQSYGPQLGNPASSSAPVVPGVDYQQ